MKNEMVPDATLLEDARRMLPETVRLRRQLHRRPETGLDLPQTQAAVCAALDGLGRENFLGKQLSSVVAVLEGAQPAGPGPVAHVHSPQLSLNEAALPVGIALHCALALRFASSSS